MCANSASENCRLSISDCGGRREHGTESREAGQSTIGNRQSEMGRRVRRRGIGGDEGTRTPYLSDANAALSRMSYVPTETRGPLSIVRSGPIPSQPGAIRPRGLVPVRRPSTDAVARLARELPFFPALLTTPRRQLASWWFENPVMHAFAHHLQRFSLGHSEVFPSTSCRPADVHLPPKRPGSCGSVVVGIGAFNGSFRISRGPLRHVSFTRIIRPHELSAKPLLSRQSSCVGSYGARPGSVCR